MAVDPAAFGSLMIWLMCRGQGSIAPGGRAAECQILTELRNSTREAVKTEASTGNNSQ